jgi:hypothetical protein
VDKDKTTMPDKSKQQDDRKDKKPDQSWADEAAKARSADDPRARTPSDAAGQPTDRSFEG